MTDLILLLMMPMSAVNLLLVSGEIAATYGRWSDAALRRLPGDGGSDA
jgi:hypothetical protein